MYQPQPNIQYTETVYLPVKEYQTYSTPIVYDFNAQGNTINKRKLHKQKQQPQKTTVTNYNPHTAYYSNG